jgi:hypothetical protein
VDTTPPAWTPTRTFQCLTVADFGSRYASALDGDRIVAPVTFTTQVNLNWRFTGKGIEIDFAGATFAGDPTRDLNAVFVTGTRHRIFGGNLSNPAGHGILIYPSSDILWHGFKVDGVGGTCFRAFGVNGDITGSDYVGEVTNDGNDPTLDPHQDPLSGLHPSYIGGDETQTGTVKNNRFVIDAHDCKGGSNQIGGKAEANEFYYRARNLTYVQHGPNWQIGGNAVQLFGAKVKNNRIWVEADNVARVVDATFLSAGSTGNIITHGRGTNVRLQPAYTPNPSPAVTYQDCQ